jgi:hypothetical protein
MNDDFNIDDFLNFGSDDGYGDRDPDSDGLREKIAMFQANMQKDTMNEAYRFIHEVGILFWIRQDMYVKNTRKLKILDNMISYFTETEEYEKCAYLHKGRRALYDTNKNTETIS